MSYFVNSFLVMCGIACGMPLLFIANRLSRKYLPDTKHDSFNERTINLMADRNQLDQYKVEALRQLVDAANKI